MASGTVWTRGRWNWAGRGSGGEGSIIAEFAATEAKFKTRPRTTVRNSDVQNCIVLYCSAHGSIIFYIFEQSSFQNLPHAGSSYAVLVYLCICICVFARMTHGSIICDSLE